MNDSVFVEQEKRLNKIFTEVRVPAKEFKLVMFDLGNLFKKTVHSKSFIIKSVKGTLLVRASANIEYVAYPTNYSGDVPDFEVACLFQDIYELISSHGEVVINITPTYVEVSQEDSVVELPLVDFELPPLPIIESVGEEVSTEPIIDALKLLLKLSPASSVYKRAITLLMSGSIAQVRYPSVWVETSSKGLRLPLEQTAAKVLLNFLKTTNSVYLLSLQQWTAVTKGISTLFIPIKDDVNIASIDELTKEYQYIGKFSLRGLQAKVQKVQRVVGKADCKIHLFENMIRVEVRTDSIVVNQNVGTNEGAFLDSFTMRLEFLNAVLDMVGDNVQIYGKGDCRCIKAAKVRILISSQG